MKFATLLFSTLAISSVAFADELDTKVTFKSVAQPLKSVIATVSKDSGVQLTVPGFLGSEPVIVKVDNVTLREFMANVAECLGGEWQRSGTSYQLAYTSRHETAEWARTQLAMLPKIIAEQVRIAKELGVMGPYNREQARIQAERESQNQNRIGELHNANELAAPASILQVTTPGLYCLQKIVASLDPKVLVQLPSDTRTVFSTNPTAMQRSLPGPASLALNEYARLHAIYLAERAALPQPKRAENEIVMFGQSANKPMNSPLGKALLIVFRNGSNSISFSLMIADQKGNIVSQSNLFMNLRETSSSSVPSTGTETPIAFSDSAKQHSTLIQYAPANSNSDIFVLSLGGSRRTRQSVGVAIALDGTAPSAAPTAKPVVTPEWRAKLLSPDKFDPLSFAVSEALLGAADEQKSNLIAIVPDYAATRLASRVHQTLSPTQLFQIVSSTLDSEVMSKDGWTVVRPLDPIQTRLTRPSRIATSNLIQTIAKEGRLGLDTLAYYLQSQNAKYVSGGFVDRYCGLIVSESRSRFLKGAQQDFELTKLWGSLDPLRRRQLMDGGKLELRLLGPNQRTLIHSLVFDSQGGPNIEAPESGGNVNRTVRAFSSGEGFSFGGGSEFLSEERTEYLSGGIPATGFVELEMDDEDAVMANSPTSEESKLFTARELGIYRSVSANTNLPGNSRGGFTAYEGFKMGKRVTYSITVQLTERASLNGNLMDAIMPPGNSYVPYEQLPADFRKTVEESSGQMKFGEPPPPSM